MILRRQPDEVIVSGDRRLLQLLQREGVRILRAVAWLDEIGLTEG